MGTPDSSVPFFLTARVNRSSETFEVLLCCIFHQEKQAPVKAWRPVSKKHNSQSEGRTVCFTFTFHRSSIATESLLASLWLKSSKTLSLFIGVDSSWDNHVHEGTLIANVEDHSGVMDVR